MREPAPLHGQAVRLRRVTADDAPRLAEILAHPEVARWWGRFDRDRVNRELVDPDDGTVTFAVEANGQVIGLIQYWEETEPDYRHAPSTCSCTPTGTAAGWAPTRCGPWPATCSPTSAITASPSTPPPTTSGRSAPTSASASGPSASCAATNAAPTAPGTTGC